MSLNVREMENREETADFNEGIQRFNKKMLIIAVVSLLVTCLLSGLSYYESMNNNDTRELSATITTLTHANTDLKGAIGTLNQKLETESKLLKDSVAKIESLQEQIRQQMEKKLPQQPSKKVK